MRLLRLEAWKCLRDQETLPALALAFALCLAGTWGGSRFHGRQAGVAKGLLEREAKAYTDLKAAFGALESGQAGPAPKEGDPREASAFSFGPGTRQAVLPPAGLAALAIGQADLLPQTLRLGMGAKTGFWESQSFFAQEIEGPLNLLLGNMDGAFVAVYLLPLLYLAMGFGLLSTDRDRGVLPLLLSQPAGLAKVVLARSLSRCLLLWAASAAGLAFGLAAFGEAVRVEALPAAMALFSLLGYLAFWSALTAWVNSLGRAADLNLSILGGAWVLLVLVLPSVLGSALQAAYPAPSRIEVAVKARDAANELEVGGAGLLRAYYLEHPEQLPARKGLPDFKVFMNRRYARARLLDEKLKEQLDAMEAGLWDSSRRQAWLSYASPALLLAGAWSRLAGTDAERHARFREQALAQQGAMQAVLEPRILGQELVRSTDLDRLPPFRFSDMPAKDTARDAVPPSAALFLAAAFLGLLARARLERGGL